MHVDLLYRGPLSACNYGCSYCPFAKQKASEAERRADAAKLERFVAWAAAQQYSLSVFFTPWGEALTYRHYHEAIVALSELEHVQQVAVQTNLSPRLDPIATGRPDKVKLWATFHPDWTTQERFVGQVERARALGMSLSVGMVGFPEYLADIEAMRAALPAEVYLWVNAVKRLADQYTPETLAAFEAVDPLFRANLRPHRSEGLPCRAGEHVVSVDGDGTVRRCHFVEAPLGNLYDTPLPQLLEPRSCPRDQCRCHIGYVHLPATELRPVFGAEGVLARIPAGWAEGVRPTLPAAAVSHEVDHRAPTLAPAADEARRARDPWKRVF